MVLYWLLFGGEARPLAGQMLSTQHVSFDRHRICLVRCGSSYLTQMVQ